MRWHCEDSRFRRESKGLKARKTTAQDHALGTPAFFCFDGGKKLGLIYPANLL